MFRLKLRMTSGMSGRAGVHTAAAVRADGTAITRAWKLILGFWYLSLFLLLQLCCAPRCRWGAMCLVGCCACFAGCAVAALDAAATEGRGRIYLSVGGRATLSGVWGAVVEAVTAAAWPMGEPSGGSAAARQARARAWRGGVRGGGG